jgi:signal transduction histidine kinase/putative methionine-R-sulfoxide reductase with GAF domain
LTNPDTGELTRRLDRVEQQLHAMREIGLALESTMSFDEVLTMAVERTTRLMDAERSSLFLVEDDGILVSRVIEGEETTEIRLETGRGLAGWVARHGRPLVVSDAYADERFDPSWDRQTGFVTRCVLAHPIVGRHGAVIGVTEVLNKHEGQFDEEDLRLLGLIAGQLALTIENSRLMIDLVRKNLAISEAKGDLERRNRELSVLLELERLVARVEDVDDLASAVLARILEITEADVGVLHRIDETGAESRFFSKGDVLARVIRVEAGAGFSGWVATKGRELCIAEPRGDPRFAASLEQRIGIPLKNLAAVPLLFAEGQNMRASLLVANRQRPEGFDETDMMMLRLVASQLAAAMEHVTTREATERERRLATVGRLLAGVLHDLKSPITVISGYTELLAAKVGGEEGREYLKQVHRALERMSTMAEEIIAFSRGERRVLVRSVQLRDFIDRFVKQIIHHLESSAITLDLQIRTSGTARLDEDKMTRAFQNIVINAVEAMPVGGSVTIEVDQIGAELIFSFTDTGAGIPEEIQGSLFQSFVTLGKENGNGLGLAVAREIVEGHGGKISFTTSRAGGTTFIIAIPV